MIGRLSNIIDCIIEFEDNTQVWKKKKDYTPNPAAISHYTNTICQIKPISFNKRCITAPLRCRSRQSLHVSAVGLPYLPYHLAQFMSITGTKSQQKMKISNKNGRTRLAQHSLRLNFSNIHPYLLTSLYYLLYIHIDSYGIAFKSLCLFPFIWDVEMLTLSRFTRFAWKNQRIAKIFVEKKFFVCIS